MSSFTTTGLYSFYYFIMITFIYFAIKYFTNESLILSLLYYLALIVGQYFINLNTTLSICGQYQYTSSLLITIIPWTIIFGLLSILLKIFPGWLSPFSNTIGYLVAKISGIENLFNKILSTTQTDETKKIITNIYNDNSLLINEITTSNFETFWDKMVNSGIFNSSEEYKPELLKLVKLKENIAELTWYLLTGILISSISYNYILNTECDKSENTMKELQDNYIKENKELLASNTNVMKRLYATTE